MVEQKDANLRAPIPIENEATIDSKSILPSYSEAVVNLQMDYLLNKKSILTKYLFKSKLTISFCFVISSIVINHFIGDYLSAYNFRDGYWDGFIYLIKNNDFFFQDLLSTVTGICFVFSLTGGLLFYNTYFLKEMSDEVPNNYDQYFGTDMKDYSQIELFSTSSTSKPNKSNKLNKLSSNEKKIVNKMKDNSYLIVYRSIPVAFILLQEEESNKKTIKSSDEDTDKVDENNNETLNFKVTSLGIRRIYIQSDMLLDLIGCQIKKILENPNYKKIKNFNIQIELYSFEEHDIKLLKKIGFKKLSESKLNDFLIGSIYGVTSQIYELNIRIEDIKK
ncbi:hypothetical protein B5S33_g2861 [[Candida] boidinii]|nr:hypothetical protein B5S33_g2861 [[Candida] boidinii]GMG00391.1 unnamed protein product [[Candida] boidinii]